MAARKKRRARVRTRAAKKAMGKRRRRAEPPRLPAKRTRRATGKAERGEIAAQARGEADGATGYSTGQCRARPRAERKPLKKAEPRSNRPPAVLPIPQSTFFF